MKVVFLGFVSSIILLVYNSWVEARQDSHAKPNIVFMLADDLGWADITPYGSTFHETPNLKRLADRSVRFTDFYAASPLCSPTRSSILTGYYPARTGITAPVCHLNQVQLEKRLQSGNANQQTLVADSVTRLQSKYITIAELLKSAGYRTAHFGKWHLGFGPGYEPKDQGFDIDIPHTPRAPGPGGGYFAPWRFVADKEFKGQPGEHIDEWMAHEAAKFIRANKDRPFYVNFWLYSVHSPWNADKELIQHFEKKVDPKARQRNPLYAAMIKRMDNAVGTVLDAIDNAGITNNTIIIFTSDNGGWAYPPRATDPVGFANIVATSNFPFRSGKASNYEGGTRVPCLVVWPGKSRPGTTSDALFCSVDFLPTILEMTNLRAKTPSNLDGVSQVSAILGKQGPREMVFIHFPHGSATQEKNIPGFWPGTSVRKGQWKLIRFYAKNADLSDRLELYDLSNDPGETKNWAKAKTDIVADLDKAIDGFLNDTEAVIPKANPKYRPQATLFDWTPSKDVNLASKNGSMKISSTGKDPYISTTKLPAGTGPFFIEIKMKSASKGPAQVYWRTKGKKPFSRERSIPFQPKHDNEWHSYSLMIPEENALIALRIDPSNGPGMMEIETIFLKDKNGKLLKSWPK